LTKVNEHAPDLRSSFAVSARRLASSALAAVHQQIAQFCSSNSPQFIIKNQIKL
jgi:hypothetical protein